MKSIQVPIDEDLLKAIDGAARKGFRSRSEFVRKACRFFLRYIEDGEKDEIYARGYERVPEDVDLARSSSKLAGAVLPGERW